MIYYRLLRNNKETGPFSEEEMIAKGFKPYDLLWAEGKSAGWQYPSEIPAFKKFAPIVEEQPFDRFYKKQPAQKKTELQEKTLLRENPPNKINQEERPVPVATATPFPLYHPGIQDLPARHIHVTLPSGNKVNLTTLVRKETPDNKMADERFRPLENKVPPVSPEQPASLAAFIAASTEDRRTPAVSNSIANNAAAISPATSMAAPVQPVYQNQGSGYSWTLLLGVVVGVAALVGLGIMIGLSMSRQKEELAFNEKLRARLSGERPALPSQSAPTIVTPVVNQPQPVLTINEATKDVHPRKSSASLPKETATAESAVQSPPAKIDKAVTDPIHASTEKNDVVAVKDENAVTRVKNASAPINMASIEKNVSVSGNNFKSGAFGGISNLKFTLVNGSRYPLDLVEVEVDYILASKKIYKTEKLLFKDISAGGQLTVDAPASSRGIKVSTRIVKINSKDTNLPGSTAKS